MFNKNSLIGLSLFMIIISLSSCSVKKTLIAKNALNIDRKNELVTLKRRFLEDRLGVIPNNHFIRIGKKDIQFVDNNEDGNWDEANLLLTFLGNQELKLPITVTSKINTPTNILSHVRHRRKNADDSFGPFLSKDTIPKGQLGTDFTKTSLPLFLTEGPAWENDKVGFRIYFDVRNGKDIWGKTTTKMIMDTVGVNPKVNYHEQASWGMDILKVGASLGAGSLALLVPLNGKDSLARLGGVNMGKVKFEILADGPLVSIFKLTYPEWKITNGLSPVSLIEEIKIWGGQYFYESNVTIINAPKGSKLVTGIVNLKSKSSQLLKDNATTVLYTYDQQSENHDELGMAIMASNDNYFNNEAILNTSNDIQNTNTFILKELKNSVFRFYAAWCKSDMQFTSESNFKNFLLTQSSNFSSKIIIKWK